MQKWGAALGVVALTCASPAAAGSKYVLQPMQTNTESVRYDRGTWMLEDHRAKAAIQVFPMGEDHSNVSFSIAVLNTGDRAANIDISNITIEGGEPIRLLSKDEMVKKAQGRAAWAAGLAALAGGLGAVAAANQRDHYSATTYTPRGTYRTVISTPSTAGQIQAAAITAGTAYTIDYSDKLGRPIIWLKYRGLGRRDDKEVFSG